MSIQLYNDRRRRGRDFVARQHPAYPPAPADGSRISACNVITPGLRALLTFTSTSLVTSSARHRASAPWNISSLCRALQTLEAQVRAGCQTQSLTAPLVTPNLFHSVADDSVFAASQMPPFSLPASSFPAPSLPFPLRPSSLLLLTCCFLLPSDVSVSAPCECLPSHSDNPPHLPFWSLLLFCSSSRLAVQPEEEAAARGISTPPLLSPTIVASP